MIKFIVHYILVVFILIIFISCYNPLVNCDKIYYMIENNDIKKVEDCIRKGEINRIDYPLMYPSMTPLMAACSVRNYKIIELLIENGANVNIYDKAGRTPLFYLMETDCQHDNATNDTIICEKSSPDINTVELLLENGANPNSPNISYQPLAYAILYKDIEITKLLLENGANPNLIIGVNYYYFNNCAECEKLLIKYGKDVHCVYAISYSNRFYLNMHPFHKAIDLCDLELLKLYFEYGLDENFVTFNSNILINTARRHCGDTNPEVVEYLESIAY